MSSNPGFLLDFLHCDPNKRSRFSWIYYIFLLKFWFLPSTLRWCLVEGVTCGYSKLQWNAQRLPTDLLSTTFILVNILKTLILINYSHWVEKYNFNFIMLFWSVLIKSKFNQYHIKIFTQNNLKLPNLVSIFLTPNQTQP